MKRTVAVLMTAIFLTLSLVATQASANTGSPRAVIMSVRATPNALGRSGGRIKVEGKVKRAGVTFVDNGDGRANLSGTPAAGTVGTYPVTITASNGIAPNATQDFVLTVD